MIAPLAKTFYSNGKLLLTGEYAVLDGALALAVPSTYGQSLSVTKSDSPKLTWKSLDDKKKVWFEEVFELGELFSSTESPKNNPVSRTLLKILREAKKLNPDFLDNRKEHGPNSGYRIETRLTFPRDWGLGSSSTLINNIAQWADVDAYELLRNAFSGSGYDLACAQHNRPILYGLKKEPLHPEKESTSPLRVPHVKEVDFNPSFRDQLYFVHLNKKQNSRDGIASYRKMDFDKPRLVRMISEITRKAVSCKTLAEFESLMTEHESILSEVLQMPTVKESLFADFQGAIKSLGAWGGDFVIATGNDEIPSYFKKKGYKTIIPYKAMVL